MSVRFLVNVGLLAIPIGTTLGVLLGIQTHRQAAGQAPLFAPSPSSTSSPTTLPHNNDITDREWCNKSIGITPYTVGQQYILNPNQWGWEASEGGGLCMNISEFNNGTYATKTTAPEFSVTWEYPQGPESQPVHAYPNIEIDSSTLPLKLGDISKLLFDVEWTYAVGNSTASTTDTSALTTSSVNANVAIDMFLDADETTASNSTSATYEIMVWFAKFGTATDPIGYSDGILTNSTVNGTTFSLYYGENDEDQHVLTWIASDTIGTFEGDLLPLLTTDLPSSTNYPSTDDYLGYFSFGSEAYWSADYTTFYVPSLSIDIET